MPKFIDKQFEKLVALDVDGTSVPGNPWTDLTKLFAPEGKEQDHLQRHLKLYRTYRNNPTPEVHHEMSTQLIQLWNQGLSLKNGADTPITEQVLKNAIAETIIIRDCLKETVELLLEMQWFPVFITGGMELVAQHLSEITALNQYPQIRSWWGNSVFEFDQQGIVTGFKYNHDEANHKLHQLNEIFLEMISQKLLRDELLEDVTVFLLKLSIAQYLNQSVDSLTLLAAIGDGDSDLKLFELADVSIAFGEATEEIRQLSKYYVPDFRGLIGLLKSEYLKPGV